VSDVNDVRTNDADLEEREAPAAATTGIEVSNLDAWFGSNHVLHGIDMVAQPRAVTAIIGPSGCGKSTLIRCLNRMHEEVRGARVTGKVLFDGHEIYGPDADPVAIRRSVGMVFQRPNPFPSMSVLENAVAGLRLGDASASRSSANAASRRSGGPGCGPRSRIG